MFIVHPTKESIGGDIRKLFVKDHDAFLVLKPHSHFVDIEHFCHNANTIFAVFDVFTFPKTLLD